MDLYEACENGNEERVVEALVYGEHWHGLGRHHAHRRSSHAPSSAPPSPQRVNSTSVAVVAVAESFSTRARASVHDAAMPVEKLANSLAVVAVESAGLALSPKEMLYARGTAGRTPLLTACMGGQLGVVQLLLGETCQVYFTSRSEEETELLLKPLADEFHAFEKGHGAAASHSSSSVGETPLFQVSMATKDGGADLVPVANVRLTPTRCVVQQDLLDGVKHVDDFGNTPLQCVSCFGCGSTERHIEDGLQITRMLLLHGDQPNLPKIANQWTPLHWAAYNGNHEQCAILLDPPKFMGDDREARRIGKTQFSIPLLVNSANLFAADVAGRRGLALAKEMATIKTLPVSQRNEYAAWRLRLNPLDVVRLFTREFLENASSLVRYVAEMNARVPVQLLAKERKKKTPTDGSKKKVRRRKFTCADAIRYGQHLLYWMGCFGLVDEVRALLEMKLEMPVEDAVAIDPTVAADASVAFTVVHLRPLYVCSCEEDKRQSVLHAVGVHGQQEIVRLLLSQLLYEQQNPHTAAVITPRSQLPKQQAQRKKMRVLAKKQTSAAITPTTVVLSGSHVDASSPIVPVDNSKLDVASLADVGWRNYRGESPLFLAVLFLQQDVVKVFTQFLSDASVAWELANCNVEGSFVHHVASDAVRDLLTISEDKHRLSNAEYVLVFDGLSKKHFKESLIDSMREESVVAPSLVVTRAGYTLTPSSLCGLKRGTRTDYVVIGATEKVLVKHAQVLQLKIKHRGSSLRSKYNASTPELFEPFRSLQRQQVVLDIIQKNVNIKKHLRKGNLQAIFPLHDASGCKNIMRHWAISDSRKFVFQPFVGDSVSQFLVEKRTHQYEMLWPLLTYFGEKHAFYYAFMLFYTVWLLMIAVPGAVCQVVWSVGHASYVAPLFSVFVSLWATLFVERWKRKRSEIQSTFGNFKRNRSEEAPEFYGDFQVESLERAVVDTTFPKSLQLARIYVGIPILLTMASVAVAIFIGVKLNASTTAILSEVFPWLPARVASYVIPVLNAVSMLVLDNVYTQVALALTQWENHRTVWQFESMLATKLFWFKFLNAFLSLFWVAFVDRNAAALRKQLVVIMGARQIWYMVQRSILPLLTVTHAWQKAGFRLGVEPKVSGISSISTSKPRRKTPWFSLTKEWYYAELVSDTGSSVDTAAAGSVSAPQPPQIVLLQELMQPHDFLLGKQMEVVLQFGYITMFVSVLPVAPLLALLSNVVSTRLDVICCTQAKRRPPFESETEVSTFMSILEFMSFAAVAVNCAVLFFTTMDDFESLLAIAGSTWRAVATGVPASFYLDKLWILLAIEHGVLGLKALLSLTIDDAAAWVQNDEDRNDDEAKQNAQQENARMATIVPRRKSEANVVNSVSSGDAAEPHVVGSARDAGASSGATAVQRVLVEKYEAAMRERDAARDNERRLQRQLIECQQRMQQLAAAAQMNTGLLALQSSTLAGNAADGLSHGLSHGLSSHLTLKPLPLKVPSRVCVLCFIFREHSEKHHAQRRCVSCHQFFCVECDYVVHVDDLGVREPKHCRVDVPMDRNETMEDEEETRSLPASVEAAGVWDDELLELLLVHVQPEPRDSNATIETTARMLLQRCAGHEALVVRYLRNVERRRQYRTQATSKQ